MGVLAHPLIRQVVKAMILEEETFKKYGYFPHDLTPKSNKRILAKCEDCGIVRETSKYAYRNFCHKCSMQKSRHPRFGMKNSEGTRAKISKNHADMRGAKSPMFGKHLTKETKEKISKGNKGRHHTEEEKERRHKTHISLKGAKSPYWKPRVTRICHECGKGFEVIPSRTKKGKGIYCSKSCRRKAQKFPTHHTKPELIFEDICRRNHIDFQYTGDGTLWIGKKGGRQLNPDFKEANGKKVLVEVMGDYWHSPLLNKKIKEPGMLEYRKQHYRRYKWQPIFIWETDLLREDAEAFVLNLLKKARVL